MCTNFGKGVLNLTGASGRGNSDQCVAHGGGKRCIEPDYGASARGNSDKCVVHGGGKRCIEPDCGASASLLALVPQSGSIHLLPPPCATHLSEFPRALAPQSGSMYPRFLLLQDISLDPVEENISIVYEQRRLTTQRHAE